MIQFNLLPDVKLDYIKSQRLKRTVLLSAVAVSGVAVCVVVLLFMVVNVFQKQHIKDQNADIKKYSQQLQSTQDLNKILTIQNQLTSLPGLHNDKVVASRLFGYLTQLTPAQASVSKFNISFKDNTILVSGTADSLSTVNKFADTLKFTTFTVNGDNTEKKAFSNVVLSSFNRSDKSSSYQMNASFDPAIFDNDNEVTLTVPKIISTRSETEKPEALFQQKQ